jgi:hypothetical protein
MAELSLIAGMNYLGKEKKKQKVVSKNKKTNDQIILDSYKQSPYHSNTSKKMGKEFDNMYAKNMDSTKYMIPSYYVPEDDTLVLGAGTEELGSVEDSFLDQFELQKSKSGKVKASNERGEGYDTLNCLTAKWANFKEDGDDMTLGVIDKDAEEFKHNNMHAFNRMRDFAEPDYEDNRPLEAFTGYSENYVPKREMKPLFKPTKNSFVGNTGPAELIALEEERMYETVGLKKNGEKLMEPKQNAPVLGLTEEDEFYQGGYDSTRIMPKTSNELRRADNQQVSYEAPMIHGKKGSKRPTMPRFEKRRANLVEDNRENFHSGGLRAQRNNDNIEMKDTGRSVSQAIIGPKAGINTVYNPKTQGKIKQSQKITIKGQVGQASMMGKRATQDINSMQVHDTQRMYTNVEYQGGGQGRQRGAIISKDENIRGKQTLERMNDGHASRGNAGTKSYNYDEKINGKQYLGKVQDGHASRGNAGTKSYNYDEKINGKQTLERKSDGHASRGNAGTKSYNYDEKINGKQTLERMNDGHASRGSAGNRAFNPNDRARNTIKQSTVSLDRSTFVSGPTTHISELQDKVRTTINEGLVGLERSTFVSGPTTHISELQDKVRNTQKQMHVQQTYSAPLGQSLNQGYITDQVTAPITHRQQNVTINHVGNAGSSAINTNNPVDSNVFFAPTTLKQLHTQEYIGNAGNNYESADQQQYYNARYNINKDQLVQGRAPTMANVNAIPTAENMGQMMFPDQQIDNYNYVGLPSQQGNSYQPNIHVEQRIMPYHSDNIGQYNTLEQNPYVNTDYYGYK